MRRRSSGSAAEEEGEDPAASASYADVICSGEGAGGKADDSISKDTSTSNVPTTPLPSDTHNTPHELDRRKSTIARSRRPSNTNWKPVESRNGSIDKKSVRSADLSVIAMSPKEAHITDRMPETRRPKRLRSPWSISPLTIITTGVALLVLASIVHSFSNRQLDNKGCRMSYMRPSFAKLSDFDTEHTRFASKYSVYLYREGMVDEDTKVKRRYSTESTMLTTVVRLKESQFYSYLGMLEVINRFDPSRQKRQPTSTMCYGTILQP